MHEGDTVEWTKTTMKGSSINMHQVTGKIVELTDKIARVKLRNGHTQIISRSLLHVSGSGPNQLTSLLESMAAR